MVLPGVPLIHQPCFDDIWDFQSNTDEINDLAVTLNKDGFAVFDFPDPNFNEIVEKLKNTISQKFDWEKWRSGQGDLRIQDAWTFCDEVKQLATNKKILEILSILYGRHAFPFQTLNFGVGTQQPAHSDHIHFHSYPEKFMCGVWIALEDVDEQNGALIYYPGSQNWIQLSNEHFCVNPEITKQGNNFTHEMKFSEAWEMLGEHYNVAPKPVSLKKGQAVIWTSSVVHGGYPISDKSRTRWSQVSHYYFDDCVYTTPLANSEAVGKIFLRKIIDISTGKIVENKFCGVPLNKEVKKNTTSKPSLGKNIDEVVNQFANSSYKNHKELPENFSALKYLELNPDILDANIDPYKHFIKYGKSEGRRF